MRQGLKAQRDVRTVEEPHHIWLRQHPDGGDNGHDEYVSCTGGERHLHPIVCQDSLAQEPEQLYDIVAGQSAIRKRAAGRWSCREPTLCVDKRQPAEFLQHIMRLLKTGSRAAWCCRQRAVLNPVLARPSDAKPSPIQSAHPSCQLPRAYSIRTA